MRGLGSWARGCPRVARRSGQRRFTRGYILGVPSGLVIGAGPGVRAVLGGEVWGRGRVGVHGLRDAQGSVASPVATFLASLRDWRWMCVRQEGGI